MERLHYEGSSTKKFHELKDWMLHSTRITIDLGTFLKLRVQGTF